MPPHNGPVSEGIRRAIQAALDSGKTAYWIADQAGISASQIYRFLHEDPAKRRGLSLDALDKIAGALGLEVRAVGAEETVAAASAPDGREEMACHKVMQPDDWLGELRKATSHAQYGAGIDPYPLVFNSLWEGEVKRAVEVAKNPEIQKLWDDYSRPTKKIPPHRERFWCFISNVVEKNPELLKLSDLAVKYKNLTMVVKERADLGRVAAVLTAADITSSLEEDPVAFVDSIDRVCRSIGLLDAVDQECKIPYEVRMAARRAAILADILSRADDDDYGDYDDDDYVVDEVILNEDDGDDFDDEDDSEDDDDEGDFEDDADDFEDDDDYVVPHDSSASPGSLTDEDDPDVGPPYDRPGVEILAGNPLDGGVGLEESERDAEGDVDADVSAGAMNDVGHGDHEPADRAAADAASPPRGEEPPSLEEATDSSMVMRPELKREKPESILDRMLKSMRPRPPEPPEPRTEEQDASEWAEVVRKVSFQNPPYSDRSYVERGQFSADEIDVLLDGIDNTEIHRLALRYKKPGRQPVERAKFYAFFRQLRYNNAEGAAILARPDIYERYLEVARRLYDYGHMEKLARKIAASDLDLEGEALTRRLYLRLKAVGIYDGLHGSYLLGDKYVVRPNTFVVDGQLCISRKQPEKPKP